MKTIVIFNSVNRPLNSTNKANVFNKFLTFISNFSVNFNVVVDISMNSNTKFCGKIPSPKVLYHIEASQLICSADQSSGLCMVQVFEKKNFFSNDLLCKGLLQYFTTDSKSKGYSNF